MREHERQRDLPASSPSAMTPVGIPLVGRRSELARGHALALGVHLLEAEVWDRAFEHLRQAGIDAVDRGLGYAYLHKGELCWPRVLKEPARGFRHGR